MQANVKVIDSNETMFVRPIELISNCPEVRITLELRAENSKYKKVTLGERLQLIELVRSGSTIINVWDGLYKAARAVDINYSTAKSIFQNIKLRAAGKYKRKRLIETSE